MTILLFPKLLDPSLSVPSQAPFWFILGRGPIMCHADRPNLAACSVLFPRECAKVSPSFSSLVRGMTPKLPKNLRILTPRFLLGDLQHTHKYTHIHTSSVHTSHSLPRFLFVFQVRFFPTDSDFPRPLLPHP